MPLAARIALTLLIALGALAQETPASKPAPTTSTTAITTNTSTTSADSNELREDFSKLLRQRPSELATILVLDPTLLSNEAFLSGYPDLAKFVAEHPEVRRNPRYYLGEFAFHERSAMNEISETVSVAVIFFAILIAAGWFIRTLIEQKRWTQLSRTQTEVHNRIIDRFGTSAEVLEYIKTPAGTRFLESAPIQLRADAPVQNAPLGRALWSIQAGLVAAAGALGLLIVNGRFSAEASHAFFAAGVIGICIGGGFIVSAIVSIVVSRRLGLWQAPPEFADTGLER